MKKIIIILIACFTIAANQANAQCTKGDCKNGYGTFVFKSGAKYVGQFLKGEISGQGICYYTNGNKFVGTWKHRYPWGKGVLYLASGGKKEGMWDKGVFVAEGKTVFEYNSGAGKVDQDMQEGCISGDCENGAGIYAYVDGTRYEGNFLNGKCNGEGTCYYANGDTYEGNWSGGLPQGEGYMEYDDGRALTGIWEQGEYIENTKIKETGCIKGNCIEGQGSYVFEDGSKYEGNFEDGLPQGKGVCHYVNKDRFDGNWTRGQYDGEGVMYFHSGKTVGGLWQNGNYVGDINTSNTEVAMVTAEVEEDPDIRVWAVIVGVARYSHMPTLTYTDDDAYRVWAFLKSPEGGALPDEQIKILVDDSATKDEITQSMQDLFSKADENDVIFFYFSGHGLEGSFLPIDFDGYYNKLYHEDIRKILDKSKAKYKICVADACHSGSLFSTQQGLAARGKTVSSVKSYYKAFEGVDGGTALLMSSKAEETSLESNGLRQGVFSHFLIRGMKGEADNNKNHIVTIRELFDYISKSVKTYTGGLQTPTIDGNYDDKMPISVVRKKRKRR